MIDPNVLKSTLANPESDGLFSLKALHKSCGGERKDQPNRWLKLESTQAFEKYLGTKTGSGFCLTSRTEVGGAKGGDTYVCRSLVIDYASWVSPVFREMVIDVFDAMLHGQTAKAESIIKIYTGHEADHPDSLPAKLGIPKFKIRPYFDVLRGAEIITGKPRHQADRMIYDRGRNQGEHIKGKHGETLLFNDSIIDVFPKQTIWM